MAKSNAEDAEGYAEITEKAFGVRTVREFPLIIRIRGVPMPHFFTNRPNPHRVQICHSMKFLCFPSAKSSADSALDQNGCCAGVLETRPLCMDRKCFGLRKKISREDAKRFSVYLNHSSPEAGIENISMPER